MELTRPTLLALALASVLAAGPACSGGKARAVEDARKPIDAKPPDAPPVGPYRVDTTAKTGDVQIRVEWKDVPQALRASPGTTPCGTPITPPIAPTVTWGIPDAFVAIDVDHGKALAPPRARIVLADCALSPRIAITGTTFAIASGTEQPTEVTLKKGSDPISRTVFLPVVGHEVEAPIASGTEVQIGVGPAATAATSATPNLPAATILGAQSPFVAITEATGQVIVRNVPVGTHVVRAWIPKRGALEARGVTGSVTVTEGALTEVTLDISKP